MLNYTGNFLTMAKIKSQYKNSKLPVDVNLLVHPNEVNYELLCFRTEPDYQKAVKDLMAIPKYQKNNSHKLARDRCLFMQSHEYGKDFLRNIFDEKLKCARALFQFRRSQIGKGKELRMKYQHCLNELLEDLQETINPTLTFETYNGLKLVEEIQMEERDYIHNELKSGEDPPGYNRWITIEELNRRESFLFFDDLIYHVS